MQDVMVVAVLVYAYLHLPKPADDGVTLGAVLGEFDSTMTFSAASRLTASWASTAPVSEV